MSHESQSNRQLALGNRRDARRSYALISTLTALSLVFGALFVASPGQAEETVDSSSESTEVMQEDSESQGALQAGDTSPEPTVPESSPSPELADASPSDPEASETPVEEPTPAQSSPSPSQGDQPESSESESEGLPEASPSSSPEASDVDAQVVEGNSKEVIATDAQEYNPGDTVTISGNGWSNKSDVALTLNPVIDGDFPTTVKVKGRGFAVSFVLPLSANGAYTVVGSQADSQKTASTDFSVAPLPDPTLDAQMSGDESSATIEVTGADWGPDRSVSLSIGRPLVKAASSNASVQVASDGTIKGSLRLPEGSAENVEVTATGAETGRIATVQVSMGPSAVLTVRKSGSRTSDTGASALDGAVFDIYDVGSSTSTQIPDGETPDYSCSTGAGNAPDGNPNASGECSVQVSWISGTSRRFLVVEQSAPSGWSMLPAFATNNSGSDPYAFNVRLEDGDTDVVPNIGSEQWANRLANPSWPGICGLDVALLFDESTSISRSEWTQMKQAAGSFVQALQGTPSRVAQFSFSTAALGEKYVPLTSVQSSTDATALINQINTKSQTGGWTNWDEGLYQIAQKTESYDAVLVLTDGDPTVWGSESSGSVRLVTVQEAVHSANAIKSEGTRIVGVGIGLSDNSEKNLAAISGPTAGSDYYLPAGFGDLDDALKEIASSQCGGTVVIEKQIGASIPGTTDAESNGWPFASEITANGAATSTVATPANEKTGVLNDRNGQLQFKYVGGEWPKSVRITELANPDAPGFSLEDIQCTGNDLSPSDVSVSGNAVTISNIDIDETVSCIFLNNRDTGSLRVLKDVSNPGGAVLPDDFGIDFECVIDEVVTKAGELDVPAGAAGVVVAGVPTGSTCTITEQALTPIPGFTWSPVSYDPRSVLVDQADAEFTVKAVNTITRDTGSLQLVKALSGGPDGFTGPFEIEYQCSMENGIVPSTARVALANGMSPISGSRVIAAGSSSAVEAIPTGYECVVSEPVLPDAPTGYSFGAPTFDPANATVVIEKDTAATVTTQNTLTRDLGNLRITKSLTGTPADYAPDFDVSYLCALEGEEDISGTTTVVSGGTVEVPTEGGIPTGYECTVTEGALPTLPAGYVWNSPEYSNNQETTPGNVVTVVDNTVPGTDQELPEDQMATVVIANSATFEVVPVTPSSAVGAGGLNISKTLIGGPAGFAPSFTVAWSCSGATGSLSGVLSLTPGSDSTIFNLPNGYSCSVTENDLPAAPEGFVWAAPQINGSPTPAISGNSTVTVSVINTLVAEDVAPVEPASPIDPGEPVEPTSPVEPASPVGFPTIIPAGGGALVDLAGSLPIWLYLAVVIAVMVTTAGFAYRSRIKQD